MINMKKILPVIFLIVIFIDPKIHRADEIEFPQKKSDIVNVLSFDDNIIVKDGNGYEIVEGRVYKIINGKKYRLRGLNVVSAVEILPKAKALISFAFNSSKIEPESKPLIDEYGKALQGDLKDAIVVIAGHTDAVGSDQYNKGLSLKRAESVRNYLIGNYKIAPERLACQGYGADIPIKPNTNEDNRAMNRRVEFIRIE